jgi:hypothetical protein
MLNRCYNPKNNRFKNYGGRGIKVEKSWHNFESFFDETFYSQKEYKVKTSIGHFFTDLFNYKKSFTKSDLDMVTTIYKILDKHIQY